MTNSRQKGAGAEREFAALVRDWTGTRLIRNLEQSRSGGHDLIVHPDESGSIADAFRKLAIECKRYQTATDALLAKWWGQATEQADSAGLMPILAYRADRSSWRVMVPMALISDRLCQANRIEYTATLSIEGFCHAVGNSELRGNK
ncbi:MAG: putative PDDEXK endonuclease [Methylobacter sp.]